METLLARQLQQAWLEAHVRKQSSEFSDPAISSFSHQTSSSSSMSPDPGAEASAFSAPGMQSHNLDEEAFHDPVLQVISNMLMDEDLEDRKCMLVECTSYATTMKEFCDILVSHKAPPRPENQLERLAVEGDSFEGFECKEEPSALVDGESVFLGFPAHEDDANVGVIPDEVLAPKDGRNRHNVHAQVTEPFKFLAKDEWRVHAHEGESALNLRGEEHSWIDDLFNNMDAITFPQDAYAGVVPSPAASGTYPGLSDSGSSHLSSLSLDSSALHEQESLLKLDSFSPSSVLADSTAHSFPWNGDKLQQVPNGKEQHKSTLASKDNYSTWSHGSEKSVQRSSGTSRKLPTSKSSVSSNSRLKRAAPESGAAVVSHSIRSISSTSSGVTLEAMGEESLSFVQNEDLNAEKCASILNNGLGSKNGMCCKSSSAAIREDVGRATIVVATVADLRGLLISCAQAVASNNLRRAQEILQEIRQDASPYGSALQRLAHYFTEGLVARLSGTGDRLYSVLTNNGPSAAKMLKAHRLFVEVCPFVKLSHYFANRTILEAAKGASRLHIIDYGILYGLQWPCLISALAERQGGPPVLRITGIDFPQPGYAHAERVEMTGRRLAEYAKTYGVPFEYHTIASRWETVQPSSLSLRQDEVVIVNSMHRLHHLLDETVLASNPRKTVLSKINEINPKLFVQGIKNGNYNAPFFMSRFKEALACFSGLFDMLEALIKADNQERMMIEREVLGRDILNVVACEGPERVERPETYRQWQNRTQRAGFVQLPLDRKLLKESQTILRCSYNKNFNVDEDGSWILLSWKGKVVNGLTLWKPAGR